MVDSYGWFKGLVSERRKLSDARLAEVSDGRVFTGHQGLALQLVDELGDERTARAWLAREKGVPENLRVRTWKSESMGSEFGWLRGAAGAIASALGFDTVAGILSQATQAAFEKAQLDGLLALWQAPAQN